MSSEFDTQTRLNASQVQLCDAMQALFNENSPVVSQPLVEKKKRVETKVIKKEGTTMFTNKDMLSTLPSTLVESYPKICEYSSMLHKLLDDVNSLLKNTEELDRHYVCVNDKTNVVRLECEVLLSEQKNLIETADRIKLHISHFEQFDRLSSLVSTRLSSKDPNLIPVLSDEYVSAINQLETSLAYMKTNLTFSEARGYLVKFQRLQLRLMRLIRNYLETYIENKSLKVMEEKKITNNKYNTLLLEQRQQQEEGREKSANKDNNTDNNTDVTDAQLMLYSNQSVSSFVELRAVAETVNVLLREVENRSEKDTTYRNLLIEFHDFYFKHRSEILETEVLGYYSLLRRKYDNGMYIRSAYSYLYEICVLECNLFKTFFKEQHSLHILTNLIDKLCDVLYHTFRPVVIHETNIEILFEIALILKEEISQGNIAYSKEKEIKESIINCIRRLTQDIQERLAYRVHMFIRDEIQQFAPVNDDINYPDKLYQDKDKQTDIWYPTLKKTLLVLGKLHATVELPVFQYLANDSIKTCMESLAIGGMLIKQNLQHRVMNQELKLPAGQEIDVHVYLFNLKHLFSLRDGLRSFSNIEFAISEHSISLPHIGDVVSNLWKLSNKKTQNNGGLTNILPKIRETINDSRKELDSKLKDEVRLLISHHTRFLVGDIISLFDKQSSSHKAIEFDELVQLLGCLIVSEDTDNNTPLLIQHIKSIRILYHLYLVDNEDIEKLLLKPIIRTVRKILEQLRFLIEQTHTDNDKNCLYNDIDNLQNDLMTL